MTWNKLTKSQQNAARSFAAGLYGLGVEEASVSQCARYLTECFAWKRGEITLAQLCERAVWTPPAPKTRQATVKQLAAEIGVSLSTIYRRIRAGVLDAGKVDGRWTITLPA